MKLEKVNAIMLFAARIGTDPEAWKATAMIGTEDDEDMGDLNLVEYGSTAQEALGKAVLALEKASAVG